MLKIAGGIVLAVVILHFAVPLMLAGAIGSLFGAAYLSVHPGNAGVLLAFVALLVLAFRTRRGGGR